MIPSKESWTFDIYDLEFTNLGWLALSPCHSVAYDMQTEMSSSPAGGLCLPAGKHAGILTYYQIYSTKK